MKEIVLGRGKSVALVDDEDYEWLSQWKWYDSTNGPARYEKVLGKTNPKQILMHRIIMNTPSHLEVDHWDHNRFNNQKSNLRNCTHKENCQNSFKAYKIRSKFDEIVEREQKRKEIISEKLNQL